MFITKTYTYNTIDSKIQIIKSNNKQTLFEQIILSKNFYSCVRVTQPYLQTGSVPYL